MSAFRTAVFIGVICGIQGEAAFASDGVQIFFEENHGCTAEVGQCGDEDRLAACGKCGESGTGDQLFDLKTGNGIQGICTAFGFLPCCLVMVVSRMAVFSGEYTEKYPQFLACGKQVYVLRFMLAVSVAISAKKNIFFCNALCGQ